jgi:hypothetical protein
MIFAIFCILAGFALGQHFKVPVLLPAAAVVLAFAIADAVARFAALLPMSLLAVGDIVSLQLGYLLGLGVWYLRIGARDNPSGANSLSGSMPTRRPAH